MARGSINLKSLDVEELLSLRSEIDEQLQARRKELEDQLARLGVSGRSAGGRGGRSHPMKGSKVAPKYQGPDGETWAGRGAQPRWLSALLKQGHKLEDFAIEKSEGARKAGGRRGRRKAA